MSKHDLIRHAQWVPRHPPGVYRGFVVWFDGTDFRCELLRRVP